MAMLGRTLDEPQRIAVDAIMSFVPGGRWAALEAAIVEPRQNGKSASVLTAVVLHDLFLGEPDEIAWSAHLFPTARKSFLDILKLIRNTPLERRVADVRESHGQEGIVLHNGAELHFIARSKGGGRGMSGKRVVMDEALFLSSAAMEALMPTMSARPNPQLLYGSSAGLETSEHLHELMKRGRAGGDPSLVWVEHKAAGEMDAPPCAPGKRCKHALGTEGCYLDDEDGWAAANPALDIRITREYVRGERRALAARPLGFARERLGWFEPLAIVARWLVIGEAEWRELMDAGSTVAGRPTIGIAVAHDRQSACIGAAGTREDGRWHVEVPEAEVPGTAAGVLDHRGGTEWLLDRVLTIWGTGEVAGVVVDPKSPAGYLIPDLEEAGVTVLKPGPDDLTSIYARFTDACKPEHDLKLRHRGQAALTAAVRAAGSRKLGARFVWDHEAAGDVTPLLAVSNALWGHLSAVEYMPLVAWH